MSFNKNDIICDLILEDMMTTKTNSYLRVRGGREKTQDQKSKKGLKKINRKYVNDRDLKLMKFCYDQGFLTRRQVLIWLMENYSVSHLKSSYVVSNKILNLIVGLEFLEKSKNALLNHMSIFTVTKRGFSILKGQGYLPEYANFQSIDETKIYHDNLVTNVRLFFEGLPAISEWITDKLIREDDSLLLPDAIVYFQNKKDEKKTLALEVEVTQKSGARYTRKFEEYEHSDFDVVLYCVPNDQIRSRILEISQKISGKIFVCLIDELLLNREETFLKSYFESFQIKDCFGKKQETQNGKG